MNEHEKINAINDVLAGWFTANPDVPELPAKELMDTFVRSGIFPKNNRDGQHIRKVLRKLDNENRLAEIPFAYCIRHTKNRNWYFKNITK